jgi:hypothetical protein
MVAGFLSRSQPHAHPVKHRDQHAHHGATEANALVQPERIVQLLTREVQRHPNALELEPRGIQLCPRGIQLGPRELKLFALSAEAVFLFFCFFVFLFFCFSFLCSVFWSCFKFCIFCFAFRINIS